MGSGIGVVPGWRLARSRRQRLGDAASAREREAGVSLVEVLVSVAIMSSAVIAIAGALGSSVQHASLAEGRSEAEAEARRVGEFVRTSDQLAPCDGSDLFIAYDTRAESVLDPGFDVSVSNVEVWAGGTEGYRALDADGCTGSYPAQRVTLRVVHDATGANATITVVKRKE